MPGFYQCGLGSAGFGGWRELAAHIMTANWVLSGEHRAFALLYHWRVLPARLRPGCLRGGLDRAVAREHGLAHFDAHFLNILTDGHALYFSGFGLALSDRFDISDQEGAFLREHRCYDRGYTAAHLVSHHVAERVRGERNRRRFVRAWAAGDRPRDVPASAAAILTNSYTRDGLIFTKQPIPGPGPIWSPACPLLLCPVVSLST